MRTHRVIVSVGAIGPALLGLSLAAMSGAQALEITAEERAACTPNAVRLCSSDIPDVDRVAACMRANEARLSPPCRALFRTGAAPDHVASRSRGGTAYPAYVGARHHVYAYDPRPRRYAFADFRDGARFIRFPRAYGRWRSDAEERTIACESGQVPAEICNMRDGPLVSVRAYFGPSGSLEYVGEFYAWPTGFQP